eukprot:363764-Chlamydomonas_euryale.AAC.17
MDPAAHGPSACGDACLSAVAATDRARHGKARTLRARATGCALRWRGTPTRALRRRRGRAVGASMCAPRGHEVAESSPLRASEHASSATRAPRPQPTSNPLPVEFSGC